MKKALAAVAVLALLSVSAAWAQHILTNKDVVEMVSAKLSDAVIVDEIHKSQCKFSTAPDDLIALKKAGMSDAVIEAMTNAGSAGAGHSEPPAAAAPAPRRDVGVYYMNKGSWADLPPEVVNWKTGGVLKSLGTAGIVKGDINGEIHGERSPTSVNTPVTFLVVVPEGAYITEYQLIDLHPHKRRREFRTVTGGVFHVSGGATRDVIPFKSEKVGDRTFKITLDNLDSGEYGFLPPGNNATRQAMSSLGAMYTFHVLE
ncbi:MAG: hypothetical protein ACRD2P_06275 [Terriglobia bacterium]